MQAATRLCADMLDLPVPMSSNMFSMVWDTPSRRALLLRGLTADADDKIPCLAVRGTYEGIS